MAVHPWLALHPKALIISNTGHDKADEGPLVCRLRAFLGSTGTLGVYLSRHVYASSVTIDHVAKEVTRTYT
ncbi:hypothetical protein BS47DRAFT_1403492 [Hydnum rufescens UP504]|uniref:Uncharacterized protein n=1 Tax=Hydnum rufescens UP504 TaxID=1448309 RepID=A0A9P6A9U0_9AGAM|nr:hypothetical protein BS47DRAFT_1403492 [Hydnum rufescens UP504]